MSKQALTAKFLEKKLPKLGLDDDLFGESKGALAESLEAYTDAVFEGEDKDAKKKLKEFLLKVKKVGGDALDAQKLAKIAKNVNALGKLTAQTRDRRASLAALNDDEGGNSTGDKTIMSKMDDRQQKAHLENALKKIGEQKLNGDERGAQEGLRFLAYEVKGSDLYGNHTYASLDKMADGFMPASGFDAGTPAKVTPDMVGKMKWGAFLKAYGVADSKPRQEVFTALAKQIAKEGVTSSKPLVAAKDLIQSLKSDKAVGRLKSHHHLMGAVVDGLLKKGGAVKPLSETDARDMLAA